MKHIPRRALALFLSVMTAASVLTLPAAASDAMGEELTGAETPVHRTARLSTNVFWSSTYSDLRTENYITYTPGSAVTPVVTYGSSLTDLTTVSSQARALEAQGFRVVAGSNGDYYNVSNGLPIGLVIADGQLKSTDDGLYAAGFRADGTAVIGKSAVRVTADLGYDQTDSAGYSSRVVRSIAAVNKVRSSTDGIYLYTYEFNDRHTTGTVEPGVDVVCRIVEGSLAIGSSVTLQVEQVLTNTSATGIQPDQIVLSANLKSAAWFTDALANTPAGAIVTISTTAADERWNDVQYAVGALYSLLEDGQVVSGLPAGLNPRTAIGQKADGTLIFYTMDGRRSGHSVGASLTQVAKRLAELDCVSAVCLDGGGSTTMVVTQPGSTAAQVINRPSDGKERPVSNHIFLVADGSPTGEFGQISLSAENRHVLAGSQVTLTAAAADTNYLPLEHAFTLTASAGSITDHGDGSYTLDTPSEGGTVIITAEAGEYTTSLEISAVASPDAIEIKGGGAAASSLTLALGESLQASASAIYNHLLLQSDPGAFTWELIGDIGTVSADGTITASATGIGILTVSAGSCSTSIPITVTDLPLYTLESFENGAPAVTGLNAAIRSVTTSAQVKLGRASAQVDYSLGDTGASFLLLQEPYDLPDDRYQRLNLWARGDGSGNVLSLATTGSDGGSITRLTAMDSTDWQLISVELPAGTKSILGFAVAGTDGSAPSGGSFWLDQLVASYGGIIDTTVPDISAFLVGSREDGLRLTAIIFDETDCLLPRSALSVTLDGKEIDFTYNDILGVVTADLPITDPDQHRVSVFARDASGNIGRDSVDITVSGAEPAFTDTVDHWAADYVAWLKTAGITSGYSDGSFRPDQYLTRQQFASMLFNYLELDAADYASAELPFADAEQISGYALPAVKALYSMGVISGTKKDGQLWFLPDGNLTRAQAAAMIGRTQEKGFASSALDFADTESIPSYAREYISAMAGQGVLSGYSNNTFRPDNGITRAQMAKILYHLL